MLNIWDLEEGMQVEQMPLGRVGTVVDWESTSHKLSCGCCDEAGPDIVQLTWNDNNEEDWIDAEELRISSTHKC